MATLRNKRKLAAVSGETPKSTRSGRTQNILDPELTQDYICQVSEEIEGRVTKKLSKEFSRTESRILGALSKLDEFLLNPQVWTCSVTVPGTSRSSNIENQGTNEDRPSDDPGAEVEFSSPHFGADRDPHMVTGATGETRHDPHMVTGVTREIRQQHHMTMETQEEIPYCSTSTSSGKQRKAPSTSQPQFHNHHTPATLEADQILLALQQLATNSNSANFNNNISRISKLPKSLTTTMPTFDGKSEKFELFENFFQTSLKIHNQLTEENKINYFHTRMRADALQTFKNFTSPNKENLAEILTVFRRKYLRPQSMATAKHKFQRLVFNPANQKLIDFLEELQKLAKDAFGAAAQAIIEQFIYAKMPPHLKKSINQAHLGNGTYEEIVSHLEKELKLDGLEAPDEMQLNTVMQQNTQQNSEKPKPTSHHCKKPGHYRNQCRQLKREKNQVQNNTDSAANNKNNNGSAQTNSNPNHKAPVANKANNTNNQRDRRPRPVFPPCDTCGRTNHSTERYYLGANAANRPPPRNRRPEGQNQAQLSNTQNNSDKNVQAAAQPLK